jgi:hypothetical protein
MSDSEWVSRIARNFQNALSLKYQKERIFLEEQNTKRSCLDDSWAKLKAAFISKSDSLNQEIKKEILTVEDGDTPDKLTVKRNEPSVERFELSCDRETFGIAITASMFQRVSLGIAVDNNTGKAFLCAENGDPCMPERVAESSIEKLLNYGF